MPTTRALRAFDAPVATPAKLLLAYLALLADENGQCSPPLRELSAKCSLTDASTRRAVQSLVDAGLLQLRLATAGERTRYTVTLAS